MANEPITPFPWDNVMAFGFGVLKLSSADFWAMTPREISHAMQVFCPPVAAPLSRKGFNDLMERFPDQKEAT